MNTLSGNFWAARIELCIHGFYEFYDFINFRKIMLLLTFDSDFTGFRNLLMRYN